MSEGWRKSAVIAPGAIARARRLRATMTPTERLLWRELRGLDVGFRRQVPIGRFVVDFACLASRPVVEIDGGVHGLPEVEARDAERESWLVSERYRVLRFTAKEIVDNVLAVTNAIEAALISPRKAQAPFPLEGGRARRGLTRAAVHAGALTGDADPQAPFPPRGGRALRADPNPPPARAAD